VADSADLFVDRSPIEETQTYRHDGSPVKALENVGSADAEETEPSIRMPSVRRQKNQPVISASLARGDRVTNQRVNEAKRPTLAIARHPSFRNPKRFATTIEFREHHIRISFPLSGPGVRERAVGEASDCSTGRFDSFSTSAFRSAGLTIV
jgi:hypothetical protein